MRYCYEIFGLTLVSDIALPRLASRGAPSDQADVSIKIASVDKEGLPNPKMSYPRLNLAPDCVWFSIDAVGRFLVTNGELIQVDPDDGADMQTVCLYILGSCLGAIVHQRKQLILHGNAIKVGDRAIIFTGPSGIGKSTTAAAFHRRGYPILADDLSVIDEINRVLPSYPQIKLWADTIKQLNYDSTEFERIRMEVDKFEMPIGGQFYRSPVKVSTVFVLHKHAQTDFLFQEVTGIGKLTPLQNQTYRKIYVKGMGLSKSHAQNCVRLAQEVRVVHITRPESGFELDRLVDLTLQDLGKSDRINA